MSSRNRIVEAAMGLFVRHGYRLTSMELVSQEVGLTRQALYHHFASKESLFRAVVEAVEERAQESACAAGLEQEHSGMGLANVLIAQITARWGYFSDLAKGSPYAEELLSEHLRQARDIHQTYVENELRLFVETIDRFCGRGTELQSAMTSTDLARCVQIAARGVKSEMFDRDVHADLERIIGVLVRGALASPATDADSTDRRAQS